VCYSLALQAYLAYGIPNSSLKRMALFHKVSRFVIGHRNMYPEML
jgi:hypothetical protein